MALKKFKKNEVIVNTMEAHPRCEFFIYNGSVYYNNVGYNSGSFSQHSRNSPTGNVNLYEYNVDRLSGSIDYVPSFEGIERPNQPAWPTTPRPQPRGGTNPFIFPYIVKDASRTFFGTSDGTTGEGATDYFEGAVGDILFGQYPMSASISKELVINDATGSARGLGRFKNNPHYRALRSKLNYLGSLSEHYKISSPDDGFQPRDPGAAPEYQWHKDHQRMSIVHIPSIFYGSQIKPGSVSLRWYVTGALAAEVRDVNQNGELIQVSGGHGTPGFSAGGTHASADKTAAFACSTGSVAGVVLYDEGFIVLTGSWPLSREAIILVPGKRSGSAEDGEVYPGNSGQYYPRWWNWGAGMNDGANSSSMDGMFKLAPDGTQAVGSDYRNHQFSSASFGLSFQGTTNTQVVTMFANARRGEVNYSNNPTFLQYNQPLLRKTSSFVYEENPNRLIKNTVSSSFSDHSASFQRQVYVSRVAIYDANKNLIGVATLGNPIRKREDEDITFKLKLDI